MKQLKTILLTTLFFVAYGQMYSQFCSGMTTLSSATGSLSDGSGVFNYSNNSNCKWLIQPWNVTSVTLVFTAFELENGYDSVLIYDGTNTSANLIGAFTGSSLPPTVTSSSNAMLIHFVSDNSMNFAGWNATYTSSTIYCNNLTTFTTTTGIFEDGSSTNNYASYSDCKWLVQPPGANSITLSFNSFDIENNYDYVDVFDGNSTSDPLLGRFTGSNIPSTVNSTGGSMLVHFTSDNTGTAPGWEATYTSSTTGGANNYCTGITTLTTPTGSFEDGSGNNFYLNNSDCLYLIFPSGATDITLSFNQFDIEDGYDFVYVYDGGNTTDPLLGSFTGDTLPHDVTSTGEKMLIHFVSDNIGTFAGWDASYTSTSNNSGGGNNGGGNNPPVAYCNGTTNLTSASGSFADGSGNNAYEVNSNCQWLIQPAGASNISLSFNSFDTESNYDFVDIYDGATTSDPSLGSFSGSSIPTSVTSSGGSMLVHFTSDNINNEDGWDASYTSSTGGGNSGGGSGGGNGNPITYCSGTNTFYAQTGFITDGSDSLNYQNNSDCKWLISPPGADTIVLTVLSMVTEYNYDYLNIYDGTTTSDPMVYAYTGFAFLSSVVATSGSMLVHFNSNGNTTSEGFDAIYTTIQSNGPPATYPPYADFLVSMTNINVGSSVDFFDLSLDNPNQWSWIFPNATQTTSSQKNPSNITYNVPGCHTVSLTVSNSLGNDMLTRNCYINVSAITGLGDEGLTERDVKVYPNPSGGKFNLYFNVLEGQTPEITISNILGEIILAKTYDDLKDTFDRSFDLSKYGPGIYFVKISVGNDQMLKKVLIK